MLVFNVELASGIIPLKEIIKFAETQAVTDKVATEYLVRLLLRDENALSYVCETQGAAGDSLKKVALQDIDELYRVLHKNSLDGYIPTIKREPPFLEYGISLEAIVSSTTSQEMLDRLIAHYSRFGGGESSEYIAFKWENGLKGVKTPDDIRMDRLFCLETQKEALTDNTLSFLRGLPANNALLYGDSGSGKSSMIKALLNEYYRDGLRLVELSKQNLPQLPELIDKIKDKSFRYIIFLDDLSFEGNDSGYKNLKVLLDGRIEKQPSNILIYATSNRRHMVGESWDERQGNEIHVNDTRNERISLSERFGLRICFISPNQLEYFKIVEGILSEHGIPVTEEIIAAALEWELSSGGRSGRTAVQFVKSLLGKKE